MEPIRTRRNGLLARAAVSGCGEGELLCGDSSCYPVGGDCCGDNSGGYCEPGYRCTFVTSDGGVPGCELDEASPTSSPSPILASSSSLEAAEIAGIAVGCGVALILAILALILLQRRRSQRTKHVSKETHRSLDLAPSKYQPRLPCPSIEVSPSTRDEFEIALVCALRLEYDAVCLLFDTFWDERGDRFGRAPGDSNTYTTGRIGRYNVVLALLPNRGKVSAASAAASLQHSYRGLRLAILVGICGGVPFPAHPREKADNVESRSEILLGDVVVSQKVIQYDLGKRYPNAFLRRDTVEDNLSRPNTDIRSLLATLETEHGRERLEQGTTSYLTQLQDAARAKNRRTKYVFPGTSEDRLFDPSYRHKHHDPVGCICKDCEQGSDPVCEAALTITCADLQCDGSHLIDRQRLRMKAEQEANGDSQAQSPAIHIGQIASGDTVVKSGEDRDTLAEKMNVVAFEMEGAGVWDQLPCIIVKGVADYADCHKTHTWQDFAAATAASAMKALLDRYVRTDRVASPRM